MDSADALVVVVLMLMAFAGGFVCGLGRGVDHVRTENCAAQCSPRKAVYADGVCGCAEVKP